jgi:hypothetical protein
MSDPFPSALTEGKWETIRSGHELVFLGGDRMLDWQPATGAYRLWEYDQTPSHGSDPLPGRAICEGRWESVGRGHKLIYLFKDRVLDFQSSSGAFRVWKFDRNAEGGDPLPSMTAEGKWETIRGDHELVYLDGDLMLDWNWTSGDYKVWPVDRYNTTDPFPGRAVVEGNWKSIRHGHELTYLSKNRMLDWEPASGEYRVWEVDREGRNDLFPTAAMEGTWKTIRGRDRKLIRVNENQVLDWDPSSGQYFVWRVDV